MVFSVPLLPMRVKQKIGHRTVAGVSKVAIVADRSAISLSRHPSRAALPGGSRSEPRLWNPRLLELLWNQGPLMGRFRIPAALVIKT